MTTPLLLDCDTGIDDAFALAYLACTPGADVRAIVSTAGNVDVDTVLRNNLALSSLLGLNAPVARGAAVPLVAEPMTAEDTHGEGGLGYATVPDPTRSADPRSGAQVWVNTASAAEGHLEGLVIGPLTTLAQALELDPELPRRVQHLTIMGGALNHRGNTAPTTEWNVAVDPEAAARVFQAFAGRFTLAPLDTTEAVQVDEDFLAELRGIGDHPVIGILAEALRFYIDFHEADGFGRIAHIHDPFVVAAALDPNLASRVPVALDVELDGTLTRGQTVADWLGRWEKPKNALIMTEARPEAFLRTLLDTLRAGLGTGHGGSGTGHPGSATGHDGAHAADTTGERPS